MMGYLATWSQVSPFLLPLMITSVIGFLCLKYKPNKKLEIQSMFLLLALAVSVCHLAAHFNDFQSLWTLWSNQPKTNKYALSFTLVGLVYFGGAFYSGNIPLKGSVKEISGGGNYSTSPACCDHNDDFKPPSGMPLDDAKYFEALFDVLTDEIVEDIKNDYEMNDEAVQWIKKMIPYTTAGGKMNRGLACMDAIKTFARANGKSLSERERCQAAALGWAIEFLQAFFLVADDVMDDSISRRGAPCWFRREEVKLIAINDSFILESCVYKILKRYFGKETYYVELVDLFIEVTRQTEMGQLLDLTSQPHGGEIDLSRFTIERHALIVKYKTAFYSFYLPVALAMIVSGIKSKANYDTARKILCIMGEYFQVQDDYLDCYGAPEVIGKVGTDIQDNKCSWLVVQALERADEKQRKVIETNYGKNVPAKIAKVKALYEKMGLAQLFAEYEEESYRKINALMDEVTDMPLDVFKFLLKKIYKRSL